MTHRLATNYTKNYCNRTLIVKVIVQNVVTCFLGHGVHYVRKLLRDVITNEEDENRDSKHADYGQGQEQKISICI